MASWCAICGGKLNETYIHYKGAKVHRSCHPAKKIKPVPGRGK